MSNEKVNKIINLLEKFRLFTTQVDYQKVLTIARTAGVSVSFIMAVFGIILSDVQNSDAGVCCYSNCYSNCDCHAD